MLFSEDLIPTIRIIYDFSNCSNKVRDSLNSSRLNICTLIITKCCYYLFSIIIGHDNELRNMRSQLLEDDLIAMITQQSTREVSFPSEEIDKYTKRQSDQVAALELQHWWSTDRVQPI